MDLIEKAEMVARWAHRNQTDLSGMPYWIHCHNVAMNLRAAGYDEMIQAIGWCHDVVEDTDVTKQDMIDLFPGNANWRFIDGVLAMTQMSDQKLDDYWTQVANNEDARVVKLFGDIPDNDDPQRRKRLESNPKYAGLGERQRAKYRRARKALMTEQEWLDWLVLNP